MSVYLNDEECCLSGSFDRLVAWSEQLKFFTFRVSREHVKGVLCADESGLNMCSRGTLSNAAGDAAVDLLKLASSLEPNLSMSSVVVELAGIDGSALSITREGTLTTVVHRVDRKSRDFD
uniref:Late endosomal/lysosomal adaptor and MAPK and MTOR activator 5 n=1 Tax=Elaeophora elaphi TaxID=1147741 RepID=A0A0R3RHG9_9BILA